MKNKTILIAGLLILSASVLIIFFLGSKYSKPKITVRPIDQKGVYVGESKSKPWSDYSLSEKKAKHAKDLKAIDESWESSRLGDLYSKQGDYENAVLAYKKAYSIVPEGIFGMELARTYEKLGRYDEGIAQLNHMIQSKRLSEMGVQNATEMITHFTAEKEGRQTLSYSAFKASQHEKLGDAYYQKGDFKAAFDSYKEAHKAYKITDGFARGACGLKFARAYEKTGLPEKAIILLNDMIERQELDNAGIQTAQEMIARLLAAKEGGQAAAKEKSK